LLFIFFVVAYRSVDDIDLFSALVAEHKQGNALIGPTLVCILGSQFRDLKFGDRFWYETKHFPASFTPGNSRLNLLIEKYLFA